MRLNTKYIPQKARVDQRLHFRVHGNATNRSRSSVLSVTHKSIPYFPNGTQDLHLTD